MKRVLVVTVCRDYWKRFEACRRSWELALANCPSELQLKMCVATIGMDGGDTNPFERFVVGKHAFVDDSGLESKPTMLSWVLYRTGAFRPTHFLFTDADIIVPRNLCMSIANAPDDKYCVADRVDLDDCATHAILLGKGANVPNSVNTKKRGMGWFQLIPSGLFSTFLTSLPWKTVGYSVFDWTLNKMAQSNGDPAIISGPFYHLRHGDDGKNWSGATQPW